MQRSTIRLLRALGFAAVVATTAQTAWAAAALRPNVVVDADVVKLGDLFDDIGDKASVAVARAPAPGKRVVVDMEWLARVARANGLDWRPASAFEQAVVERSGVTIQQDQIATEVRNALIDQGVPANSDIELNNRGVQITVPLAVSTDVGIRDLVVDARHKSFSATVEVPANTPGAQRVRLTGRFFSTLDIPVLAHAIPHGDIISAHDLTWSKVREDVVRRDAITDADQIIGLTPRQALRPGQMISAADLERPQAVGKGAMVTMTLKVGGMTLTSQGRAIEPGSLGDTIRVVNTRSNITVEAKVDGPNMVSVTPAGGPTQLSLAN